MSFPFSDHGLVVDALFLFNPCIYTRVLIAKFAMNSVNVRFNFVSVVCFNKVSVCWESFGLVKTIRLN